MSVDLDLSVLIQPPRERGQKKASQSFHLLDVITNVRSVEEPISAYCAESLHHLCRPDREKCTCSCHAVEAAA